MFQGHILQCEGKHVYISAHYFEDCLNSIALQMYSLLLLYMAGTMMLYELHKRPVLLSRLSFFTIRFQSIIYAFLYCRLQWIIH